jgi:hypothetical protein
VASSLYNVYSRHYVARCFAVHNVFRLRALDNHCTPSISPLFALLLSCVQIGIQYPEKVLHDQDDFYCEVHSAGVGFGLSIFGAIVVAITIAIQSEMPVAKHIQGTWLTSILQYSLLWHSVVYGVLPNVARNLPPSPSRFVIVWRVTRWFRSCTWCRFSELLLITHLLRWFAA